MEMALDIVIIIMIMILQKQYMTKLITPRGFHGSIKEILT